MPNPPADFRTFAWDESPCRCQLAMMIFPTVNGYMWRNRLYHNNGDGTFTDVTEQAGLRGQFYGQGVAVGDYDNDGHPDIYVTNFGHNLLYRNNGNGTFTDVTAQAGVAANGWSTGAAFLDYERDGLLDLFVTR